MRVMYDRGVKIKYAQISEGYFSVYPYMRFMCDKCVKIKYSQL